MSGTKDTLLRQLTLLRLIPEAPRFTSTAVLQEKLQERGFEVTLRSVQRDLVRLSGPFQLTTEKRNGRNAWSFIAGGTVDLRDIESPTALALALAEEHLQNLLPQSVLDLMAPQFSRAWSYINSMSKNHLSHWSRSVRAIPNGKCLLPAEVSAEVWAAVSNALLERKQIQVSYLGRNKTQPSQFVLHPAGVVSRHAISYLIASVNEYTDLRQFALHRIQAATVLEQPAKEHPEFNIDHYIRDELNSAAPIQQVTLEAIVSADMAWVLKETPLAEQQQLTPMAHSENYRLVATVPDDSETLWWVFGLGEHIQVQAPTHWRKAITERLQAMQRLYPESAQ
ncbi:helix-turn-helix transcriptional regulator [Thiopseudomonas alkaliphila]|uniref:helix-turn-helix transcriptional regulator n=1 Tax=Thiopseudomonas alkaliphila TaxID=1697053 RepID=UPI00069D8864|nr:WYL domain-containing protein [Thiopseudomonas alkaliphila]AKX51049.1 transcriptional regulator [Thiopseudomonas alkaliphila]AKX57416.1 transcriptional regulator [Thiopseudomonas alkaliphila]